MPEPEGALRDRLILDSFRVYVKGKLTSIGWFAGALGTAAAPLPPINWITTAIPDDQQIPPNTLLSTIEDTDPTDIELGSSASTNSVEFWFEFWAVEDALGRDVIHDLMAILRGQRRDVDADEPSFPVFDVDGETELFSCDIDDVRVMHGHDPRKTADRHWFAVTGLYHDERE